MLTLTPFTQGKLSLISGPVSSGKATAIENILNSAKDGGLVRNGNFLLARHIKDDPKSPDKIGEHPAIPLETPNEIAELIKPETSTIIIGGISHFQDKKIIDLVDAVVKSGRRIIATALNLDAGGKPYNHMPGIMALTDELFLTKSICEQPQCSNANANRSLQVPGADHYIPVCHHHYNHYMALPTIETYMGSLDMFVGPMFSSKSNSFARRREKYERSKLDYAIFKWKKDARYGESEKGSFEKGRIMLHNKESIEAINVDGVGDIRNYLDEHPKTRSIMIDEIQFFPGFYDFAFEFVSKGYTIVTTGLTRGFNRQPFGDTSKLMCLADNVEMLYALCVKCQHPGTENQRMKSIDQKKVSAHYKDPLVMPGGSESYEARCLNHWRLPGRPKLKYKLPELMNGKH